MLSFMTSHGQLYTHARLMKYSSTDMLDLKQKNMKLKNTEKYKLD